MEFLMNLDFHFRILKIDLSTRETSTQIINKDILERYIGGASLGAWLLNPYLSEKLDPLAPEAPLLFITGPLTGTLGPAVGRFVICAKSPATRLWGESNVGGHFGPELRATGYDGLLIVGKADHPIYISIAEDAVSFHEAQHLWGVEDTYSTQSAIKEELDEPGMRVATIGVAGENKIPFAIILCDHGRVAGRTGMGAVMGSKNLKAVAVCGNQPVPVLDQTSIGPTRRRANISLKEDNISRVLRQIGTSGSSDYFDYIGAMPKKYFTKGIFDKVEKISGSVMEATILIGTSTCNGCVVACGRVVALSKGDRRKGPEYETIVGFGPNLEISDLGKITQLAELCDRYGMDTISLSNVIGLLTLLYQEEIITERETEGLQLKWGDPEMTEKLIHLTARREGIGKVAARGARWVADHFGVPGMAAQVNGLEIAYHDPRGLSGMAVVYATSPRGACHNQSDYYMVDAWSLTEEGLGIEKFGRQVGPEKAKNIALHQNWRTVSNSLVVCILPSPPVETLQELLTQVTGMKLNKKSLMKIGERGWNLKRLINLRLGLTMKAEKLPDLLLKPLEEGAAANYALPFVEMMEAYYSARSWDKETGFPKSEKLEELGLVEYDHRIG
jgi:aldehyde:ferredoxin oxidoreductase